MPDNVRRLLLAWIIPLMIWFVCGTATAASYRHLLFAKYDWSANKGFYLTLENDGPAAGALDPSTLYLILGVADGSHWRYIKTKPAWTMERAYNVKAVIKPGYAELYLDNTLIQRSYGGYTSSPGPLVAGWSDLWSFDPSTYYVRQSLAEAVAPDASVLFDLSVESTRNEQLFMFNRQSRKRVSWLVPDAQTQTLSATFSLHQFSNPRLSDPFVDTYGQCRYASWPAKVAVDADLITDKTAEETQLAEWGLRANVDNYGGYTDLGWKETGTLYFRVVKRDGYWWMISPSGNPMFYTGVCDAPAATWEKTPVSDRFSIFESLPSQTGTTASAWGTDVWGDGTGTRYVAPQAANLVRKYGTAWESQATNSATLRVKTLGFSGMAKWCGFYPGMPTLQVLGRSGVPVVSRHPDVFDLTVRNTFRQVLYNQINPHKTDPMIVGWSLGSEIDEIFTGTEIREVLAKNSSVAAKKALSDYALSALYDGNLSALATAWRIAASNIQDVYNSSPNPSDADVEALRQYYADAYYRYVYETIKSIDPNHLYIAAYIVPGWWENENDWRLIGKWCDVIGYDFYNHDFEDNRLARLIRETDKPVLCGEFSFPALYRGTRGFGAYQSWANDDAESGDLYTAYCEAGAANPYCVGVCWFQYRDQPITGRGPGRGTELVYGENYAFGIVDITDRIKWDLATRMRQTNLGITAYRQARSDSRIPLSRAVGALRYAGGLWITTDSAFRNLDVYNTGSSVNRIDMVDAIALAKRGL
jgi:hypothetical protein